MGRPLIEYALRAIPKDAFKRVAVVSQYGPVLDLAGKYGFISVENQDPAAGVSHTIRLGLDALQEMDAAMFMVADQPCLRPETVQAQICLLYTSWSFVPWTLPAGVIGTAMAPYPCCNPQPVFP